MHSQAEAIAPDGGAAARSSPSNLGLVVFNLVLLVSLGLTVSGYYLYYTDVFPIVGGLLGLGGLFSWIAFLSNVIPDERKKELQARFDAFLLQRHRTWIGVAFIGLAFATWASGRGTVAITSPGDDLDRVVSIHPEPAREGAQAIVEEEHLPPHSTSKFLLPTSWWGSRVYRVKVSGLPAATVEVSAFRRNKLVCPGSCLGSILQAERIEVSRRLHGAARSG